MKAKSIVIAFLALQLMLILYARFVPVRYFCWAPYDQHTRFTIEVTIDGNKLKPLEVAERYHYKSTAFETRSIDNIFDMITQYEHTYGKEDNALVTVTYNTNGHGNKTWSYGH